MLLPRSLKPAASRHMIVWVVFCVLYSAVRNKLGRILNFYSHKIKPVHLLYDGDSVVRKLLDLSSLLDWWLTSLIHGTFCRVTKTTFSSMDKLTPTIVNFGQQKTLQLSRNNTCILKKWLYDVVSDHFTVNAFRHHFHIGYALPHIVAI